MLLEYLIPDYFKRFQVTSISKAQVTRYNAIGRPMYLPVQLDGLWLPEEPMMTITLRKDISRTKLAGYTGRGSVKQLIALDDYRIQIVGVMFSHGSREYPEDAVRQLKETCLKNASVKIKSKLTDLFDITRIVIEEANIPAPGKEAIQPYEINCFSDDDFVLDYTGIQDIPEGLNV